MLVNMISCINFALLNNLRFIIKMLCHLPGISCQTSNLTSMQRLISYRDILVSYWKVTKPRLWLLLVYTGIGGYITASEGIMNTNFIILVVALITGTAGANVITSYIDRDIDAVMIRTMNRPIPAGKIRPAWKALIYGLALTIIGVLLLAIINIYALIFGLLGLFDNIIIYSAIFKRRNPLNIILGSFSGGTPAVIGYVAYTNSLEIFPFILAALIVVWTPVHIWSIALYYKDDYRRAGVPMLPVVVELKTAIRCIASTTVILILFSYLIPLLNLKFNSPYYLIPVTIFNIILFYIAFRLIVKPDIRWSWRLFKYSSPYLASIFSILILISIIK